jgi:hypothetical protein
MKLRNAARYFDTCPVYDGYSGAVLYKVQTSTFLESAVEGSTAARRVISMADNLTVPPHNVLLALGELWLVGASNPDEWKGSTIRKAYWTKKVTDELRLFSVTDLIMGATGVQLYGQKKYLRETINNPTDAELDPMWDIYVSKNAAVERSMFFRTGSTLYRIRIAYVDVDGFMTCQSDEVDEPLADVIFNTVASYDPVSDRYAPGQMYTKGVTLDYAKSFSKESLADLKPEVGDLSLIVSKLYSLPKTGDSVLIQAGNRYAGQWRILNTLSEGDSWNLHIRRL